MKNLNDKNFDTAIDDDNVTASQHITEVALLDDNQSDFVNKFLVEGMVRTCDYMVKNNNLAIKGFESAIDTEFRNNPEQPSESVIVREGNNISRKQQQNSEWLATRDVIVKQIRVNYPDWVLGGSSSNTLSKAQKDKLVADAKKRVATK